MTVLRQLFCNTIATRGSTIAGTVGLESDERDGFGPVRIIAGQTSFNQQERSDYDPFTIRTLQVCMRFVAAGPLLRSISGEPTKDTEVTEVILGCGTENSNGFLTGFSLLLSEIQRKTFSFGNHLQRFLDALNMFFIPYEHKHSKRMQQVLSQFLYAILELWLGSADVRDQVQDLPNWLLKHHRKGKAKYRTERDAFIRFIDKLVFRQPHSLEWLLLKENEGLSEEHLLTLLPLKAWNEDNDIRVRFRVAILNARLFHALQHLDIYPSVLYTGIQGYFNEVEVDQ